MNSTIVVGAGTAGCLVSRRLIEAGGHVVLLEAGAGTPAPSTVSRRNWLAAQREPGWSWPDLIANRSDAGNPAPYLRGRGVGGSSAINGMLATIGPRDAFDTWPFTAQEIDAAISAVLVDNPSRTASLGPFSTALSPLLEMAGWEVQSAPLNLQPSDDPNAPVRRSAADYLADLDDDGLHLVTGVEIDRLLTNGGSVTGVRSSDGRVFEADEVVLAAGSVHTPTVLLRSGIAEVVGPTGKETVGARGGDHPSIAITVRVDKALQCEDPEAPPITLMAERNGIQVLPLDHVRAESGDDPEIAVVTVALLDPAPSAHVELGTNDEAVISLRLLADSDDRHRLASATAEIVDLLTSMSGIEVLDAPAGDDLDRHLGPYSHLTSTCAIGRVVDREGIPYGGPSGLRVIDSSALPQLPPTNPMLPTLVLAELMAGAT